MIVRAWQRALLAAITLSCAAYLGYRVDHAGGFDTFLREVAPRYSQPDFSSLSASPTAMPSPASTLVRAIVFAAPASISEMVDALNAQRAAQGLTPLVENHLLTIGAQRHAQVMAGWGYINHTSPDGVTFEGRMRSSGYKYQSAGENIGLTTESRAIGILPTWMASPVHRANILNGDYRAAGIGIASGSYQGVSATYIVVIFGDRR